MPEKKKPAGKTGVFTAVSKKSCVKRKQRDPAAGINEVATGRRGAPKTAREPGGLARFVLIGHPAQKAPTALRAAPSHRYTDTLSQNGWAWYSPVLDVTHAGCSG